MKKWLKTSLLTAIVLIILMIGISYVLNLKIVKTSAKEIEFGPGQQSPLTYPNDSIQKPKNIIVFIADGMGFSHLSLAMLSGESADRPTVWQQFPVKGWHDTRSVYGPLTDSGASATAMATGKPTNFGVIGLDHEGNHVKNAMEVASENQYVTGIVTDSYIWDATPAAFVAHTESRENAREILTQMAASELDLIFGELEDLGEDEVPDLQTTMDILNERFHLLDRSLSLPGPEVDHQAIAAIYEEDEVQDMNSTPNLKELTETALRYLSSKNTPFMLMVESEEMDSGSHSNDSKRIMRGLTSIEETIALLLAFAKEDGETLLVFTADHETGGLAAVSYRGLYPNMELVWSTRDHTAAVVPILAYGPGSNYFAQINRNWHIGQLLKEMIIY